MSEKKVPLTYCPYCTDFLDRRGNWVKMNAYKIVEEDGQKDLSHLKLEDEKPEGIPYPYYYFVCMQCWYAEVRDLDNYLF